MSFRNDEQVEALNELFKEVSSGFAATAPDVPQDFFRTVVFECPVEASLSWRLSSDEQETIQNGFGTGPDGRLKAPNRPTWPARSPRPWSSSATRRTSTRRPRRRSTHRS